MANIVYKGDVVNSVVEQIYNVVRSVPSLSTNLRNATNQIISARGFQRYIGGVSSDTFSSYVEKCGESVNNLVKEIRQDQIKVLSYSQDKSAINEFLDTLDRKDYKSLDLSEIEEYIGLDRKAGNILKGVGGSVATAGLGLLEGVADFAETGADLVVLGQSLFASIFTKGYDLLTGSDVTSKMWEETKAWVSDKKVENIFNRFYDNNPVGQAIKENAYGFEGVRGVGKGLGYTAGIIALTALTGGIAPATLAATAGTLGFSNGTEEAWADGASVGKGLLYGAATGAWEGAQWYAGGKINQIGGLGDKIAKGIFKGASSGVGTRIALDTVDSGLEGFVRPALSMIYKDYGDGTFVSRYKAAFDEAGGWGNVGMNAAIGAIGSAIGEYTGARRYLKEADEVFKNGDTKPVTGELLSTDNDSRVVMDATKASSGNLLDDSDQMIFDSPEGPLMRK